MPSYTTPLEAVVQVLRGSGIADIDWGDTGSPYYQAVPEGQLERADLFPYVVLDIPDSSTEYVFQGSTQYLESYQAIVNVVALEPDISTLASPYGDVTGSVIRYLDSLTDSPGTFSGANYDCLKWLRKSWVLRYDPAGRAPGTKPGARVWVATAVYDMQVEASYGGS